MTCFRPRKTRAGANLTPTERSMLASLGDVSMIAGALLEEWDRLPELELVGPEDRVERIRQALCSLRAAVAQVAHSKGNH